MMINIMILMGLTMDPSKVLTFPGPGSGLQHSTRLSHLCRSNPSCVSWLLATWLADVPSLSSLCKLDPHLQVLQQPLHGNEASKLNMSEIAVSLLINGYGQSWCLEMSVAR